MLTEENLQTRFGNDLAQLLVRVLLPVELAALDSLTLLPYLEARRYLAEKQWKDSQVATHSQQMPARTDTSKVKAFAVLENGRNPSAASRSKALETHATCDESKVAQGVNPAKDNSTDGKVTSMLQMEYLEAVALYNLIRGATPLEDILTLRSPEALMKPNADVSNILRRPQRQEPVAARTAAASLDYEDDEIFEAAAKRARAHLN
ncbi:MAG: hypothetical protein IPI58_05375 [Alphaproteobacteria bacterium]|nr:MAG: hypothetical protein IPI58_05375 [Alphaproteobacteria bacterium]